MTSSAQPVAGASPSTSVSLNSLESARVVVPLVLQIVDARAVVDFGCKHGEWLSVFREHGAGRIRGFDLPKRLTQGLLIAEKDFSVADLRQSVKVDEPFDLAVCIEVAEHLPEAAAASLVKTLTEAAPVALFSAAVPDQGGHGHLNERPRPFWEGIFGGLGFTSVDCIRPSIWQDPRVAWWYRQNLFLFCSDTALERWPALRIEANRPRATDLDLLHVDIADRRRLVSRAKSLARTVLGGRRTLRAH